LDRCINLGPDVNPPSRVIFAIPRSPWLVCDCCVLVSFERSHYLFFLWDILFVIHLGERSTPKFLPSFSCTFLGLLANFRLFSSPTSINRNRASVLSFLFKSSSPLAYCCNSMGCLCFPSPFGKALYFRWPPLVCSLFHPFLFFRPNLISLEAGVFSLPRSEKLVHSFCEYIPF